MTQKSNQDLIKLSCSDRSLQNYFFYRLCQSFPLSKGPQKVFVNQNMPIEQISEISDFDFSQWIFSIQDKQYAFTIKKPQENKISKSDHLILLFEAGERIEQQFLQQLKLCLNNNPNILLIICKSILKIKDLTIKKCEKQALELLADILKVDSQKVTVIHTCLEGVDNEFKNKIDSWLQKLSSKQHKITKIKENLQQIIKAYQIVKCEQCFKDLLQGNIDEAVICANQRNRHNFRRDIMNNKEYIQFVDSLNNSENQVQIKGPYKQLKILIQKYGIKKQSQCIEQIIKRNLDDALKRAKKADRDNFKSDILSCEALISYWNHTQPIKVENKKQLLRKQAEIAVKQILELFGVSDVQQFCYLILQNKLEEVIPEIPSKERQNFRKQCQECKIVQQYLTYKQEADLKQEAKQKLQILLKKYKAKNEEKALIQLFQNNLDDAVIRIGMKDRQLFKAQINSCQEYQKYLKSFEKSDEKQVLKKESIVQIIKLLEKYEVVQQQYVLEEIMNGNISEAINEISSKERNNFMIDYQRCQKIKKYLSQFNKVKKALLKIIDQFQIQKKDQCLQYLLKNNMNDALLRLPKNSRPKFSSLINSCEIYMNFIGLKSKPESSSPQLIKNKAIKSINNILAKYNIKQKQACLKEILSNNLKDAKLKTKKTNGDRDNFIRQLNQCHELLQFWESQKPPNSLDLLKKQLTQMLQSFAILEIQQCVKQLLQNRLYEVAQQQVHSSRKEEFINEMKKCSKLNKFLQDKFPKQKNLEKEVKQVLEIICAEFSVTKVQQCVSDLMSNNMKDALTSVNKQSRLHFSQKIEKCELYQLFIKRQEVLKDNSVQLTVSLMKIIQKYKSTNKELCLQDIMQGNLQNAKLSVGKSLRIDFINEINRCENYKSSFQQEKKSKKNVQSALRSILSKYVSDIEDCIQSILQNQTQLVLEEIRSEKRTAFLQELQRSAEYQQFLANLKPKLQQKYSYLFVELTRYELGKQEIQKILQGLEERKITPMMQHLGKNFYSVMDKIMETKGFYECFKNCQTQEISYFYYFVDQNELNNIMNLIMSNLESTVQLSDSGLWLKQFSKLQIVEKLKKITQEMLLLEDILTSASNEKAKFIYQILQRTKSILTLVGYMVSCKQIQTISQNTIKLNQLDKLIVQKEREITKAKNNVTKQPLQNQKKKLQKLKKINDKKIFFEIQLETNDKMEIVFNYIKAINNDKISQSQLNFLINEQRKRTFQLSNSNNNSYFIEKQKQIKFYLYSLFFKIFQKQIKQLKISVFYEDKKHSILLQRELTPAFIQESVKRQIGTKQQLLIEILFTDKKRVFLQDNIQIKQNIDKIICFKKMQFNLQFRKSIYKIDISKQLSPQSLHAIVYKTIQAQKLQMNNIRLLGIFGESSVHEITESIEKIEINRVQTLKFLRLMIKMSVNIYYEMEIYKFTLDSNLTIDQVKKQIYQTSKIPIQSQSLLYAKENKEEQVFSQKLQQIQPNGCHLTLTLISKMNLEHYGFHENYHLSFADYQQFFIQKKGDMQNMVNSCSLRSQQERNFFEQLIRFLYSSIKRKFPFSYISQQVKDKFISKNSQQIWSGPNFSEQFILYYILYNADKKLRIQLMNILRTFNPLPLYFRVFHNINHIKDEWVINNQIVWLMHEGFCITSIGLHTSNIQKEKGKTYLNNKLLFTNFQDCSTRHPISQKCPEIILKALGGISPVNIIDVPAQTPTNIVQNILNVTDLLIIHSWKGKIQSQKEINQIKAKHKIKNIVCFLRDDPQKNETITKVKNANFQYNFFLQLHNIRQNMHKKQESFIKTLRDKIWDFANKSINQNKYKYKIIYKMFNNQLFEDFNRKLAAVKNKFFDMKIVSEKYQQIKDLKKQNNTESLKNADVIKQQAIKRGITSEYLQILLFIDKNKNESQILMLRFRQILKEIKSQVQRKYFIINQYKKKIALLSKQNKQDILKLSIQATKQISALPKMRKICQRKTQSQMLEELATTVDFVQNDIKSNFFTIEIAWRQLQYLTTLGNQVKLGDNYLIDFLIDLKRKEISNSQPFQLLDGDLLQMPKNITKKVFQGIYDRVAVITILGPQSSGKSTLLNFLFGCDFGTSEGRCTKGVYGTFFKFSNTILSNCEGVFLIDTQGLFATLNKKDTVRRRDFDSKLVLFCLAVSDFVIINTKGNLDSESSKILKSSMERFSALAQQNIEWPQIFLILNQNNNSNIQTSQADINKFRDIFSVQNAYSLNQAYTLVELTKKDISMLPQDQNLVKRQPRREFLSLTNELQHLLINKIESKTKLKPIGVTIDLMERVWSTIEAFPQLGRTSSKRIQDIQHQIKNWRIQKIEKLSKKREEYFEVFRANKINQKKCQQSLIEEIIKLLDQFKQCFLSEKDVYSMVQQQKIKIELEQKKIQLAFQAIKYQLISQIKDYQKYQLAQKAKSQGGQYEKEAIRIVKKIQRDEKISLSSAQKQKYFNEAFNKFLEKIKLVSAPQQQLQSYFERIYEFYSNASNISITKKKRGSNKNAGLPKAQWKCQFKMNYLQFSQTIRDKILMRMGKESNKYIEFKKIPPKKVLDQNSRTDAKLQYFNMRDYFQKVKINNYYQITIENLRNCLKNQILKRQIAEIVKRKKNAFEQTCFSLFEKFNIYFRNCGFQLRHLDQFQSYLSYKMSFFNIFQPKIQINWLDKNYAFNQHIINQIRPFLKFQVLQCKLKQIRLNQNKNDFSTATFLGKCLRDIVQWKCIISFIEKSKNFDSIKKEVNEFISSALINDLEQFGISIYCENYYQYIYNGQTHYKLEFKRKAQIKFFENQNEFFKKFKKIRYFDENTIRKYIKKSLNNRNNQSVIQIGGSYEQTFEVKEKFKATRQLKTYISSDTNSVFVNLQSDTMKQFVYNQLVSNKKFQKLIKNIDKAILKSPDYLTLNTITGIFIDVNREITQFNDDLSQVSHKLTLLFTGYIHLYAIYLTWKKFSQLALQVANKPYLDLLKARQKQLSFFLNETSDNQNLRSQGQTDRFLNEIINYCETIIKDHKKKINENNAKQFKKDYPRQVIQSKIDNECFSVTSKQQDWVDYLTNPTKIIKTKYDSLIKFTLGTLSSQYKVCQKVDQLIKQFKQVFTLLLEKLKSEGLTQDTIHTDIIGIVKKTQKNISISDNEVLEKINDLMMKFLLDLLVKDQKKTYVQIDFDIQINQKCQNINLKRQPTPHLQALIGKLRDHKLSLTRFYTFVQMINKKLHQRENANNILVEKFDSQIKKLLQMTSDDQRNYISMVSIKICKELCPGCQRICGVEEPHTNNHECKFGHQMRALGGVKLSNGEASVIRCEDVDLMSEIEFNGTRMTWKQFKEYWGKKSQGSWSFNDLKTNNNKQVFVKAWDITGQAICKRFQMKYVKSNALEEQKMLMAANKTHYIFALDDSGSMSGQKWTDLMTAYKEAIEAIKKIPNAEATIKISVLIQGSTCLNFQENIPPSKVNLNIAPRYDDNNFADTFGKAYKLMTKYVGEEKIKYIFMTDGGDSYPNAQVNRIRWLQNSNPRRIEYYGIEFQTSGKTMKLISKELNGSNVISYNAAQLTSAYLEIINRKT